MESLPLIALQEITGGRGLFDGMKVHKDANTTEKVVEIRGPEGLSLKENQLPPADGTLFFDKLSSVYLTGTMHDENSRIICCFGMGISAERCVSLNIKAPAICFAPPVFTRWFPPKNTRLSMIYKSTTPIVFTVRPVI